ncbi:MAG: hypothetical protein E6J90_24835 [Deltaproteobacteria bacterium]|nr:MAG: hypothetical protein E6J90_24835 [Deltaproteobacteria bacterium]
MIGAGQSIGNYRILSKIGTGGMGAVYLAEHPLIGKRVALKVIHRELANNREVVSRFFQEARAVNKIGNEHIVEIHDFGVTPEGDHFYIMEYLEGRTLASVLSRETALDVMRSLHIGAQIANALAAAHAAGIVHRDLKPDNIMLMSRLGELDFVKVLDFGLAKVFSAGTAVKTAAGVLLGTPQYMSPEACESKRDIDHRTDIYALGVLLFQMMTGALPFDGESMGEVLVKQVTMLPPAPRGLNPAIPPSVEQILLRCLAKPVDARFPTMLQLREALLDPEAYLRGSPPIAPARALTGALNLGVASTLEIQTAPVAVPAALQKTRIATAAHAVPAALQKTRLAAANPLPLPAPAMSLSGAAADRTTVIAEPAPVRRASSAMPALAPPQEPKMNTMRIATPVGYSSRPPRKVWPVVLTMAMLLGVAGGVLSVTCFGHDGGAKASATEPRSAEAAGSAGSEGRGAGGGSDGQAGGTAIAATAGNSVTRTVSGGGATGGGAATAAGPGTTGGAASVETGGSTSAAGAGARGGAGTKVPVPSGTSAAGTSADGGGGASKTPRTSTAASGSAATGARGPTLRTAHLTIESVPSGAQVKGPGGTPLGKTPLKIEWPMSDVPVKFALRLGGYKSKQKQTVINGNTRLVIELERVAGVKRGSGPSSGSRSGNGAKPSNSDGLLRPGD